MWNYIFQLIFILIQVSVMHDVGRVRGATFSARASRIALLSIRWKKIIDITSKRVKPIRPGDLITEKKTTSTFN